MAKLFLFAVGGTGSRVLRSFTMLLAAGVKATKISEDEAKKGVEKNWEIVPIIIDPQSDNGDVVRAQNLLNNYILVRNNDISTENKTGDGFFAHQIILKEEFYKFKLELGVESKRTVGHYFGLYDTHFETKNKDFARLLFSGQRYVAKETTEDEKKKDKLLDLDMKIGFEGNPNVGSIVLAQIAKEKDNEKDNSRTFLKTFSELINPDEDRIFIVSSVFGGTGASAFPIILKMLRSNDNDKYFGKDKAEKIRKIPIASLVVMPYFNIDNESNAVIKSSEFIHKTKIALEYYENNINPNLEVIYYIKDDLNIAKTYDYNSGIKIKKDGEETQKNDSHFIEFASALSIFDFLDLTKDEIGNRRDIQKGFAVGKKDKEMKLEYFSEKCCAKLAPKLFSFFALKKFFEDYNERKEYVKQPWALDYGISKKFLKNKQNLEFVLNRFEEWIKELQLNDRSLKLFNFERRSIVGSKKDELEFKGTTLGNLFATNPENKTYFEIDSELNKKSKIKKDKFLKIFFESVNVLIPRIEGSSTCESEGPEECIFKDGIETPIFNEMEWSWFNTERKYNRNLIEQIREPENVVLTGKASIPSPFAKLDVLNIVLGKSKKDDSSKRIISRFLDVAELLFNYDLVKDYIKFVEWELGTAKSYNGQNPFLKSLRLHLEDTLETKNFKLDLISSFFIIKYKSEIIGATSPLTLFFATDDNINPIQLTPEKILFSEEGKTHRHLNERDPKFREWFLDLYKEVIHKHSAKKLELEKLKQYLSSINIRVEKEDLENNKWNEYEEITFNEKNSKGELLKKDLTTLGVKLRKKMKEELNSDFIIDDYFIVPSEKTTELNEAIWIDNLRFKEVENLEIKENCIPGTKIKYEKILSSNDFFAEKIIQVPYEIDDKYFFMGTYEKAKISEKSVLLPLKKDFFKLFFKNGYDSLPEMKIENFGQSIDVKLIIPIKNKKKICFKKTYDGDAIEQSSFNITIFPFFKYPERTKNVKYFVHTVSDGNSVKINNFKSHLRTDAKKGNKGSEVFSIDCNFDYMEIEINDCSNFLIPKFKKVETESTVKTTFNFAVDFGTSNTNIEYSKDGGPTESKVLSFEELSASLGKNLDATDPLRTRMEEEFLPPSFKGFPHPTAFAIDEREKNPAILLNCNGSYVYGLNDVNSNIETNIKWSDLDERNREIRKAFIREKILLIKAKILNENGNLGKLVCFHPSSMCEDRTKEIRDAWKYGFRDFFENSEEDMIFMSESFAPYHYYKNTQDILGIKEHSMVITIDIGGATSDVLAYKDSKPIFLTSLQFAGNALFANFGNNVNHFADHFADKYIEKISKLPSEEKSKLTEIENIINFLRKRKISSDTNAFLFSIKKHPSIRTCYKDNQSRLESWDYATELKSVENSKIIFIYFYSAIIYHIKKLFELDKDLKNEKLMTVVFSGNGSKILNIIGKDLLKRITDEILNANTEIIHEIVIENLDENDSKKREVVDSKRLSCMGGIKSIGKQSMPEPKLSILSGFDGNAQKTFKEIKKDDGNHIIEFVKTFNEYFKNNIYKKDIILTKNCVPDDENSMNSARKKFEECIKGIRDDEWKAYLQHGLEHSDGYSNNNLENKPSSSLLFFPIIGFINKFITTILKKDKK